VENIWHCVKFHRNAVELLSYPAHRPTNKQTNKQNYYITKSSGINKIFITQIWVS